MEKDDRRAGVPLKDVADLMGHAAVTASSETSFGSGE
jgi:hypothetical protein